MRLLVLIFTVILVLPAIASTDSAYFEKNLKKVGKSLDETTTQVKTKVHNTVKEVDTQATARGQDLQSRVASAFSEMGDGFARAWKKLKGEQ